MTLGRPCHRRPISGSKPCTSSGVVVWFAGLFYLVRLFIYHVEADSLEEPVRAAFKAQYALMEQRLANIITTPGMVVAVLMAVGLLIAQPLWLKQGWMHAKLAVVLALLAYHWFCYRLMGHLRQGTCAWSGGNCGPSMNSPP